MVQQPFVDFYETLQLSPNATTETVERVYRLLAKRYHPDNKETGDTARFTELLEAFQVLSDPERRAAYDAVYEEHRGVQLTIVHQASTDEAPNQDRRLFQAILSLLYVARRRDPINGGLGALHLERMMGCPQEHLAFPLWYLRQHHFIETLDSGVMAITVQGIDRLGDSELTLPSDRLLTA